MSQCVPNWDLDDPLHHSSVARVPPRGSRADYEVAELTWVNGHPSMHGLGHIGGKPNPKFQPPWDKGGGTLESVVDQATGIILIQKTPQLPSQPDYDIVPWIAADQHNGGGCSSTATPSAAVTGRGAVMDALVPCSNRSLVIDEATRVPEPAGGRCKRARDGNSSASGSAASMGLPMDTCEGDDLGLTTSTSPLDGSPDTENTSCRMLPAVADEHDSVSHSRNSKKDNVVGDEKKGEVVRSSVSTKRSRAAAVHNQSERKRRDRINQRMKTLQKLVPNSSKTDKASMLDEVIEYLKQLQAQVQMMSRMSTMANPMMMPIHMQQLQMAMMAQMAQMAQMGMGLGMAMGVDINPLARPSQQQPQGMGPPSSAAPVLHPPSFMPLPFTTGLSRDGGDQRSLSHNTAPPIPPADPFSAFMACQPQMPVNMDAFNRMAAAMFQQMYQQQQQPPPPQQSPSPNK